MWVRAAQLAFKALQGFFIAQAARAAVPQRAAPATHVLIEACRLS